jgi:hypothetical protein
MRLLIFADIFTYYATNFVLIRYRIQVQYGLNQCSGSGKMYFRIADPGSST